MRPVIVGGGLGGIILLLISLYLGIDPSAVFDRGVSVDAGGPMRTSPADEEMKEFVSTVVGYTEDTWSQLFQDAGRTYRAPKLVLFTGAVDSACGFAEAAVGPFYCSGDERVYLDMSFFQDLQNRFHSPGDFAQAYVIAHEIGHHVQNLLGITDRVEAIQRSGSRREGNQVSVRLELQADCLAGVWANQTERMQQSQMRGFLESGDVDEALGAASMIGDDRLQLRSQGYVVPESFTHGSAEQRSRWFKRGFETGTVSHCDTFNTENP
jgi:hypothetical protein